MKKLNMMNWQYLIVDVSSNSYGSPGKKKNREIPLNDVESMIIGKDMKMIKNDPSASKLLSLPTFDMEVNLYSSVVTTSNGRTKLLMKSPTNDRIQRARAEST